MIIGITGKIGAGKSTVVDIITKKYNCKNIILDDVAKVVLKDKNVFMKDIVKENSFLSPDQLEYIQKYIHPLVWDEVHKLVDDYKKEGAKLVVVETALPTEPFFDICDETILVINNNFEELLKLNRKYSDELISQIIKSQLKYDSFYEKCSYSILNDKTIDELEIKVVDLINKIYKA